MTWLGHADAAMVRRYCHLDAKESQGQMNQVLIPAVTTSNGSAGKEWEYSPQSWFDRQRFL